MIKAIVFDFEGIMYFEADLFSRRYSRDFGLAIENFSEFFRGPFQDCLVGKADLKEILIEYAPKWGWKGSVDELLEYWFSDGRYDPDIIDLVKSLRAKGIACMLCTNNEKHRLSRMDTDLNFIRHFDWFFPSHETGMLKPDRGVFEMVCKKSGFSADEIVFLDDEREHVAAARKFGMHGILYSNMTHLRSELAKLGVVL